MTESEAIIAIKDNRPTHGYLILNKALDMAINALEKHIAKKPKEYEDKYYGCPVCGNILLHKWEKYPDKLMDKGNGLAYCLGCGQKIDWSEEE